MGLASCCWISADLKALLDCQVDLMSLLSQLNHVLSQLERPWRKALLERTRLIDPSFIGDVLAVICKWVSMDVADRSHVLGLASIWHASTSDHSGSLDRTLCESQAVKDHD